MNEIKKETKEAWADRKATEAWAKVWNIKFRYMEAWEKANLKEGWQDFDNAEDRSNEWIRLHAKPWADALEEARSADAWLAEVNKST